MRPDLTDYRITAYVLNELSEQDRIAFEKELNNSEELQKAVQAVRETTELLSSEFKKEVYEPVKIEVNKTDQVRSEAQAEETKVLGFWQRYKKSLMIGVPALAAASVAGVIVMNQHIMGGFNEGVIRQQEIKETIANRDEIANNQPTGTESKKIDFDQQRVNGTVQKPDTITLIGKDRKVAPIAGLKNVAESEQDAGPGRPASKPMEMVASKVSSVKKGESAAVGGTQGRTYLAKRKRMNSGGQSFGLGRRGRHILPPTSPMPEPSFNDSEMNAEEYSTITENDFKKVIDHPLSTFSIDVDTASYANMRRFLNSGQMPPKDSVRIEEMINYFSYDYDAPKGKAPFSTSMDLVKAPWNESNYLLRVGLKGKEIQWNDKGSNLVFLLDVSGSMNYGNKLPLVKKAMRLLIDNLTEKDKIAIVVYAGNSGLVLPSTSGDKKEDILKALDKLQAGGSTNGGAGIELAYKVAKENFIKEGVNRVILATDGDFNVGVSSEGSLVDLIQKKAKTGVFLSVLGFGMGNYKDNKMEKLANKGNGNYAYIDTTKEAKKVLVEEMGGTLVTIAKDVKLQIEFNPGKVAGYRLIGYENRMLAKEDFNNDKKDAGELGAGHRVTALYEIVPAGQSVPGSVDSLKYQKPAAKKPEAKASDEWLTLKLRYKKPDASKSELLEFPFKSDVTNFERAKPDFKFAAAVAGFGMLLRDSKHSGTANFDNVLEWAIEGQGKDDKGYRDEFIKLIRKAKSIKK